MKIPDYNKKIKHPTYLEMLEEIKRLKEEYVMLQNASDEVEEEKDKEIERLNSIINKIKSIIYNSFEYNALTKVALIRESLQGSGKE